MKFERVILENFRPYYGRQRLEFARDVNHNVTVIEGANGVGKTSLFLALNWCLYGRYVENVRIIDNVGELASKEAVKRAAPSELVCTSVEIAFLHNGDRYIVKRVLEGVKQQDDTVAWHNEEPFTMMRIGPDGQANRVGNPIGAINTILPVNVREYFLFDGEKIDNFSKPESVDQVREAIYLVLKLEILERARRHLNEVAKDYRKELKQISGGELRGLLEEEEKARAERSRLEKRIEELGREITSAKRKVAEIDQELREKPNAKVLQQQRDQIENNLNDRRVEFQSIKEQIRDKATTAYFVLAQPAIDRALHILDTKRERGEIPSNIRQCFVQDLLDQMRCICGRIIEADSPEYRQLLALRDSSIPGTLEDDVLSTYSTLQTFAVLSQQRITDLDILMQRKVELVEIIEHLDAQKDDVGRQLKGFALEEVGELERKREAFLADNDSNKVEIGSLKTRIDNLSERIKQLEKDIAKARKEEKRATLLSTKLSLAQGSADAIDEMYHTFADDMRQRIEAKTKEVFKQLVWKDSHFQDIQLGSDFNLEVIDRYGLPARPELSAGERQVLSLAFITAMSRISEEEAPLVMDTPFGRLSAQHRNNITEHLPSLADQLVLFITDEELHGEARDKIESRIGAEYRLEFNKDTSCTEIVEVH